MIRTVNNTTLTSNRMNTKLNTLANLSTVITVHRLTHTPPTHMAPLEQLPTQLLTDCLPFPGLWADKPAQHLPGTAKPQRASAVFFFSPQGCSPHGINSFSKLQVEFRI